MREILYGAVSVKFNGVIINFLCMFNIVMENIKGEIGC